MAVELPAPAGGGGLESRAAQWGRALIGAVHFCRLALARVKRQGRRRPRRGRAGAVIGRLGAVAERGVSIRAKWLGNADAMSSGKQIKQYSVSIQLLILLQRDHNDHNFETARWYCYFG